MCVNNACNAGKERRKYKYKELIKRYVYAHCFCGNFVVAYCGNGSAVLASYKVVNHKQNDKHNNKRNDIKRRVIARVILDCARSESHCFSEAVNIFKDGSYYFSKGKCYDCKVVALEP